MEVSKFINYGDIIVWSWATDKFKNHLKLLQFYLLLFVFH
jgi:hypothetical protein